MLRIPSPKGEGFTDPQNATLNNSCFGRAILGQLDRALLDCDEALRLSPRFADALDSRALVHLKRGEYDMAIVDYTAALDIAPKMPLSLFGRAIARERSGDPAGAKADAEAAASLQPGVAEDFRRLLVKLIVRRSISIGNRNHHTDRSKTPTRRLLHSEIGPFWALQLSCRSAECLASERSAGRT